MTTLWISILALLPVGVVAARVMAPQPVPVRVRARR